jgi:hypothetical protein
MWQQLPSDLNLFAMVWPIADTVFQESLVGLPIHPMEEQIPIDAHQQRVVAKQNQVIWRALNLKVGYQSNDPTILC